MNAVIFVSLLAVAQYMSLTALVGRARSAYGIKAPAITGHEQFERYYRVQMNTLELLVAYLPALWLAAQFWSPNGMAAIGAVYLLGRTLYARSYIREPDSRGLGFLLSLIPIVVLLVAGLIGVMLAMLESV
ncbi:MAPEG family protein [Paucibacter sp. TC2R-5]|uniref:MAPEG family protein n=1 Tax=Paucibacter sp. TC2R-5 TaxID=2893555 RepID=UPI0021E459B6|nr:MAPEG family protein [Paucibacter sp. TC2R-5]MCV2360727.1 MAPEG family protein [Paucibacter sp. TC2R-5]